VNFFTTLFLPLVGEQLFMGKPCIPGI
jgi:hypothetical protein